MRRAGLCLFVARSTIQHHGLNNMTFKRAAQVFVTHNAGLRGNTSALNSGSSEEHMAAESLRGEKADTNNGSGPPVRLMTKAEVLNITGFSFPTIWKWMRAGHFPRSRVAGGRSVWRSDEVHAWLENLQVRRLKGDAGGVTMVIEKNTRGPTDDRIIRQSELPVFTGLQRTTIYTLIKAGKFPKPIPLGERNKGWLESELIAWQQSLIAKRNGEGGGNG
jgi:prophage regulatory protein